MSTSSPFGLSLPCPSLGLSMASPRSLNRHREVCMKVALPCPIAVNVHVRKSSFVPTCVSQECLRPLSGQITYLSHASVAHLQMQSQDFLGSRAFPRLPCNQAEATGRTWANHLEAAGHRRPCAHLPIKCFPCPHHDLEGARPPLEVP